VEIEFKAGTGDNGHLHVCHGGNTGLESDALLGHAGAFKQHGAFSKADIDTFPEPNRQTKEE